VWRLISPLSTGYVTSVNAYLLEDDDGYTLVDGGVGSDDVWALFVEAMGRKGVDPGHVRRVLLTHAHHDHAGLAARLASLTGARVWMHERDLDFYNRRFVHTEQYRLDLRKLLLSAGTPSDEADELAGSVHAIARVTPCFPSIDTYREDDVFGVGGYCLAVMWTPGHTPGHVCFADSARSLVICGDHILPNVSPNVAVMPDSDDNPLPGYLDSLRDFVSREYRTALPGHGDAFDISGRAQQLLDHQLQRQARVRDILQSGPRTPYAVAEQVWQRPPNNWPTFRGHVRRNAVQTIMAHLELLVKLGEVERSNAAPYCYALTVREGGSAPGRSFPEARR
jgi:glyoxylase-like metal-dependent hydrolase (beta-lactamase superfamily II)